MTARIRWTAIFVIVVLALSVGMAATAVAIPDEFGGAAARSAYAPYTEASSAYVPGVPERVGNYLVR